MSYSVLNAKQDLTGILHGTSLNQIQNLNGVFNRAARQVLMDVDPMETIRFTTFTTPIYNLVYDYYLPTDLKGNAVIDIFPQVERTVRDIFVQQYNQAFDILKNYIFGPSFTIKYNNGIKTARINAPNITTGVVLNACDGITTNGTWSVGGTASNLTTNYVNFASGSASLQFDLAAGVGPQVGYIENSTVSSQNLSLQEDQAMLFWWVYLPTAADFSSIELRWGSSASDYWKGSATIQQDGTSFQNGWNLLATPWNTATQVGSPNSSAVTYLRITYNYNGNVNAGTGLDSIMSQLGTFMNLEYYSKFMFRDAITGGFQETVTDDSNLINLDTDTYNLFLYKVVELAVQQQQGLDALFYDGNWATQQYQTNLASYKSKYKSQKQKPQSVYYQQTNPSYQRYISGNRWNY